MKKVIFAALTAAMAIGAAVPASAWTYSHCKLAQGTDTGTVSNKTIAKECHAWMLGEGMVSRGKPFEGHGKTWREAYPDIHWRGLDDSHLVVNTKSNDDISKIKFYFQLDGNQALRTKVLSNGAFERFLDKNGYEKVEHQKDGAPSENLKLNSYYYTLTKGE